MRKHVRASKDCSPEVEGFVSKIVEMRHSKHVGSTQLACSEWDKLLK